MFDLRYELDLSIQPVNIKTIGYSLKAKKKKFVYLLLKIQLVHPHKTPTPTLLRKKRKNQPLNSIYGLKWMVEK